MTGKPHLTADHLRPSDILLHHPGNAKWYDRGIAWCTASPYTHASIYLGDGDIAEARLKGVRICSVTRPIRREKALCVLRQASPPSPEQVDQLRHFAQSAVARGAGFDIAFPYTYYSRRLIHRVRGGEPATPPLGPLKPENCNRYFCVSFIIDAIRAMGLIDRSERHNYQLGRHSAADLLQDRKFGYVLGHLAVRSHPAPDQQTHPNTAPV
ncbi:hypothetical protein EU803_18145 [Loktanella sp. IMCC34160]|uniref:hypothetical protein n=1 Tax=Loktanella sp. IMCC34160 TaxID=2510646 RepID=UPI00101D0CAE|nr:hypothetical protein [Loktanella sp. IMCC34160]RYG89221.1 hypothetical protein EU803_18145 [Loktanella sp. IMCC34160]